MNDLKLMAHGDSATKWGMKMNADYISPSRICSRSLINSGKS